MQAVDLNGNLGEYFLDDNRKITKAHLDTICLLHRQKKTCRYIGLSVNGYVCVKKTPMKKTLDQRCKEGKMSAQGDNCGGMGK